MDLFAFEHEHTWTQPPSVGRLLHITAHWYRDQQQKCEQRRAEQARQDQLRLDQQARKRPAPEAVAPLPLFPSASKKKRKKNRQADFDDVGFGGKLRLGPAVDERAPSSGEEEEEEEESSSSDDDSTVDGVSSEDIDDDEAEEEDAGHAVGSLRTLQKHRRELQDIQRQRRQEAFKVKKEAPSTSLLQRKYITNSRLALETSPWREFQVHPRVKERFQAFFERRPQTWEEYMGHHEDLEFRVHSLEVMEWNDIDHGGDSTGIGVFGMIDAETRIYVQFRDIAPYCYIGIPNDWTQSFVISNFLPQVLLSGPDFEKLMLQEWALWPRRHVLESSARLYQGETLTDWMLRINRCFHAVKNKWAIKDVQVATAHDMEIHRHIGRALLIQVRHERYLRTLITFFTNRFVLHCLKKFYRLYVDAQQTKIDDKQNPCIFKLYEPNIPFQNRFIVDFKCCPGRWVRIKRTNLLQIPNRHVQRRATCAFEVLVVHSNWPLVHTLPELLTQVPLRYCSFDLEVYSKTHKFPDSFLVEDLLYLVNINYWVTNQASWIISIYLSDAVDDIWDIPKRHIRFAVRHQNVREWYSLFQSVLHVLACDARMAYNNTGFDDFYLWNYAATCGLMTRTPAHIRGWDYEPVVTPEHPFPAWGLLSRLKGFISPCKTVLRQSQQMGTVENNRVFIPGEICEDLLLDVRQQIKLPSYALGKTAGLVGMKKVDLPAQLQFEYFESGLRELHEKIDEYCKWDALIPRGLHDKFRVTQKYFENCSSNWLQPEDQIWTGQQARVRQNLLLQCRNAEWYEHMFLLPYRDSGRRDDGLEGGDEEIAPDLESLTTGVMATRSVGFNPRKDLYCWDPRYDLEVDLVTGRTGAFGTFPPVQRRIMEAKERRVAIMKYTAEVPGSSLPFTYRRSDKAALDHEAKGGLRPPSTPSFKRLGDSSSDEPPSKRMKQEHGQGEEKMEHEQVYEASEDTSTKSYSATFWKDLIRQSADSVLAEARYKAEGLRIQSVDDQFKSRSLLQFEKVIKVPPKAFPELKQKLVAGATVLMPKRGFYGDPVITFDFEALYPNIILSVNMSYDTKVGEWEIKHFMYSPEKDFYTVITKLKQVHFKLDEGHLCPACEAVIASRGEEMGLPTALKCPLETRIPTEKIRADNLVENRHFRTLIVEKEEKHYTKQMCDKCMTCKDCAYERTLWPGGFCPQHKICAACPSYRHRALICGVVSSLLNARAANKKLKKEHGTLKEKHFFAYLELAGLPRTTNPADVKPPEDLQIQIADATVQAKLKELWVQYKEEEMLEDVYDMRQSGDKITGMSTPVI